METEFESLDETYNSLDIVENALLICQIFPLALIAIFSFTITQIIPWIHLPLAFVFSIIISWLIYCKVGVKLLINAMIYSEERNLLYDFAIRKKLLIKEGIFSTVFYFSRKDKNELSKLLSNPAYKRNSIQFKVRTSLIYLLFLLFSSIILGLYLYSLNVETKAQKIRYWTILVISSFGLLYSLKGLLNRQPILTLLPEGIKLPEENIITFDKIKEFKIIRKGTGRYSSKYITFQHLTFYMGKETYIHKELEFQNCNVSVKKLNYHFDLNMKNYNR